MSSEEKVITIKLLPFNGKELRWGPWKKKFLVQASRKGYKDVMLEKEIIQTQTTIDAMADGDVKSEAQEKRNKQLKKLDLA